MDTLTQYQNLLENILKKYTEIPYRYGDITTSLIISRDCQQFLLMDEGWEKGLRVHGCLFHCQIISDKIWIHYDGIEDSITDELVAAGVPKEQIVLAFYPPEVRVHTGYAVI
jgi:hypothetical protein